jgi:hypothetical protein
VINVLVRELAALEHHLPGGLEQDGAQGAPVRSLPGSQRAVPGEAPEAEDAGAAEVASSMRAVAPPIQSFASGRRR